MKFKLVSVFAIFIITSCSSNKFAATNKSYKRQAKTFAKEIKKYPLEGKRSSWVGTTNFGLRKPDFVIIHHTAQNSCDQTLHTFTTPHSQVSAHYVICKDGTVHHMLNDYLRAWQAGISSWGNQNLSEDFRIENFYEATRAPCIQCSCFLFSFYQICCI